MIGPPHHSRFTSLAFSTNTLHRLLRVLSTAAPVLWFAACNSQHGNASPKVITHSNDPIPSAAMVDLYHDGQLCHWVRNMHQDR
jgi:hypothetical protein